jgi:hypothetical protein
MFPAATARSDVPGSSRRRIPQHHSNQEIDTMTKLFSALILTAFAFGAQAASHAGGAPMKDKAASAPAAAASAAKKDMKKDAKPAAKKEEAKK